MKREWDTHSNWQTAEAAWETRADVAKKEHPLKLLKTLPQMPGITEETAKNLKWKSFKYMISHDQDRTILKNVLKHPVRYGWRYLKSLFKKKSYSRDGDFFLYNVESVEEFHKLLDNPESPLVVGFSYCHKPHECPSGRFTTECVADVSNPVCQQCFIGKMVHALPQHNVVPLFITTIHYVGDKIFETVHANPGKQVLFIITACEMTLEMFGDWGNMVAIRGIGVRLDGRICNTMRAFELSEEGVKPGLTVVLDDTQARLLDLVRYKRESGKKSGT